MYVDVILELRYLAAISKDILMFEVKTVAHYPQRKGFQ